MTALAIIFMVLFTFFFSTLFMEMKGEEQATLFGLGIVLMGGVGLAMAIVSFC